MTRLSYVDPVNLSPEQKSLYDAIALGPRAAKRASLVDANGHLTGPFNAFLHLPALGAHWSAIGETLRFRTAVDRRLFELAVLVIAAHWKSGHEWAAHAKLGREAAVEESTIDALRAGREPDLIKPDEGAVYRFVRELIVDRRVQNPTYSALVSLVGEKQVVELVNAIGYYVALAAMLNAFAVHPPKGLDDPWPD